MWIAPFDERGLLDRGGVLGFLDDAEQRPVARRVAADSAQVALGDVAALATEGDALLGLHDGRGQSISVGGVGLDEPERESLGRLRPHAGEPRELVDQLLDGPFVHATPRAPRRSRPGHRASPARASASSSSTTSSSSTISTAARRRRGLADHADDVGLHAEQLAERGLQLGLLVLDLLRADLAIGRERQLEGVAVVGRDGRRLEDGGEDHLAARRQMLDQRWPRATEHGDIDAAGIGGVRHGICRAAPAHRVGRGCFGGGRRGPASAGARSPGSASGSPAGGGVRPDHRPTSSTGRPRAWDVGGGGHPRAGVEVGQALESLEASDQRVRVGVGLGHGRADQREFERQPRRGRPAHVVLSSQQQRDDARDLVRGELLGLDAQRSYSSSGTSSRSVCPGRGLHEQQISEVDQRLGRDVAQVLTVLHQPADDLEYPLGVADRNGVGELGLHLAAGGPEQRADHLVVDRGPAEHPGLIQQRQCVREDPCA